MCEPEQDPINDILKWLLRWLTDTSNLMAIVAFIAIGFGFNGVDLGVEVVTIYLWSIDAVILAAIQYWQAKPRTCLIPLACIFGCCLALDLAWSLFFVVFSFSQFVAIENIGDALKFQAKTVKSLQISTSLIVSWFVIWRYGRRSLRVPTDESVL